MAVNRAKKDENQRLGLSALTCMLLGAVAYVNSLDCGFCFDDLSAITENKDLRPDVPWSNLLQNDFWGTPMHIEGSHKSYRPLTVATFRLNYMLHELEPLGYHLVNVLLHSAVCYLYVLLCGVVFSEVWPALIAGLLFAVHPIHTEAVAGVVGRAELLSAIFFLTAVLTYRKTTRKGGVQWQVCSMACAVCAMLSKEQGITVVGFCIVYDFVSSSQGQFIKLFAKQISLKPCQQMGSGKVNSNPAVCQLFRRTLAMVVFGTVAIAARVVWCGGRPGEQVFHRYVNPPMVMDTPYRQLSWSYLIFVNSWLLLNPFKLCADWRFGGVPLITSLIDPLNLLTLLTVACVGVLGVWCVCGSGERHRTVALSLFLLILPYLPASNLFFPVGFVVAERVLYLPSMGFCMLVGYGAWHVLKQTPKTGIVHKLIKYSLVYLVLSYSLKTVTRNRDWRSGFSIYTSSLKQNPTSGVMLSNLGVEYAMEKDYDVAEMLYRRSMEVAPSYSRAFFNFGKLMKIRANYSGAEWGFRQVVVLGRTDLTDSKLGEAYYHLIDVVSSNPRRINEALEICERALELSDSFSKLYISYSNLLMVANRTHEVFSATKIAAEKNPTSTAAQYNLGLMYMRQSQLSQAAVAFRRALALQEDNTQVIFNLASILQVTANGRLETLQEALELWIKLLSSNPHHTDALVYLASLYYELKDFSKTRHTLLQILQQSPNHTDTHYRLGVLDYKQGNYQEAMESFLKLSALQPGYKKTDSYLELTQRELLHRRTL